MTSLNSSAKICSIILLMFLFGCSSQPSVTFFVEGKQFQIFVELAQTPEEHEQGLMYRTHLDQNAGMLFVFENEKQRTFWMKNTIIPLDLIALSTNNTVVGIKQNFQPCTGEPCERYTSPAAKYILEVNAGFAERNNIIVGTHVMIEIN